MTMNCKGFYRKWSWPKFKVLSGHSPGGTDENHKRDLELKLNTTISCLLRFRRAVHKALCSKLRMCRPYSTELNAGSLNAIQTCSRKLKMFLKTKIIIVTITPTVCTSAKKAIANSG
jgi:hypothetical protein